MNALNLNLPRFLLASAAVFVFTFAFDYVAHGIVMMPHYQATASVWRPMAEMEQYCTWSIAHQALIALALTFLFTRNFEGGGVNEGLRFGLYVGVLLALTQTAAYAWLPVPMNIPLGWGIIQLLHALGAGVIIALLYKKPA